MTEAQKRLRDEAAENFVNQQQEKLNYVVGMPVSPLFYEGLQQGFKAGHDFAFERARVLEAAMLKAIDMEMSGYNVKTVLMAALAEYREEKI